MAQPRATSAWRFAKEMKLKGKRLKAKLPLAKQSKSVIQDKILPKLEPLEGIRIPHPYEILSLQEKRHVRETLDAMSRSRRMADTSKGSLRIN